MPNLQYHSDNIYKALKGTISPLQSPPQASHTPTPSQPRMESAKTVE